jgi:hypothetical protein
LAPVLPVPHAPKRIKEKTATDGHEQQHVNQICRIPGVVGGDRGTHNDDTKENELKVIKH